MESNPSFPSVGSTPTLVSRTEPHPHRSESAESTSTIDSSWDVVDDLPLRWATDFVPLAANGSRMCNLSVLAYDVWHERRTRQRGNAYLAVAVKSNIFMYYAAKGERAFRLVKVCNNHSFNLGISGSPFCRNSTHRSPCEVSHSCNNPYKTCLEARPTSHLAVADTLPISPVTQKACQSAA